MRNACWRIYLATTGIWSLLWAALGWIGNLQTAKDLFGNHGKAVELIGQILTSHWTPSILFLIGCVALLYIHFSSKREAENVYSEMYQRAANSLRAGNIGIQVLLDSGADKLKSTDEVARLCDDLVRHGEINPFHIHPAEPNLIKKSDYLDLLSLFRKSASPLKSPNDQMRVFQQWEKRKHV